MFNLCTIGYFICELVPVPKFLSGISESASIYSVSSCIGKQHPCLSVFGPGIERKRNPIKKEWDGIIISSIRSCATASRQDFRMQNSMNMDYYPIPMKRWKNSQKKLRVWGNLPSGFLISLPYVKTGSNTPSSQLSNPAGLSLSKIHGQGLPHPFH